MIDFKDCPKDENWLLFDSDGNCEFMARRISKNLYLCGDGVSDCESESLYAARVALCAAQQAHLVQRIILGLE